LIRHQDLSQFSTTADRLHDSPELMGAIRHYKAHLIARRQDSRNIFARLDLANTGYVRVEHVQTAFVAAGIELAKEEFAALIEAFCDAGRFSYRRLDERATREVISPAQITFLMNPLAAAAEQAKQITWILVEIKNKLAERKKRVRVLFLGVEAPAISTDDFTQRLDRAGLQLGKAQVDMLVEAYAGEDKDSFDWKRFVTDCEESSSVMGTSA
jgi:Ca2+-binding EF-hand superfamily protein